jgi:hypothetical protein
MADEKQPGSGFGGGNLVLLAVAAASAVYLGWQKPPLVASRPSEVERQIHYPIGVQDVAARLWQDPFGPVAEYIDDHRQTKPAAAPVHDVAEFTASLRQKEPPLILAVALPGGRSPVAIEERRRLRYAVLAALHTENYLPADAEHLGLLHIDSAGTKAPAAPNGVLTGSARPTKSNDGGNREDVPSLQVDVPYEWFDRVPGGRRAAVMWLDEGVFGQDRRPIGHLERLATILGVPQSARLVALGPHDSTVLAAMMREIAAADPEQEPAAPILTMYNFSATSEAGTMLRLPGSAADKHGDARVMPTLFLEQARVRYYRTIAPDTVLALALAEELRRRRVDPGRVVERRAEDDTKTVKIYPDHVALISEWDSVYGQTLPEVMTKAFGSGAAASILRFGYLRGLDGRLPARRSRTGEKPPTDNSGSDGATDQRAKAATNAAHPLEIAEGQGQFDYLRRLAEQMRERDRELRRHGRGRIAAIGVLGSDVYDKLLILQALKPEFPDALFFTTDLDALLWTSSKSEYTRNLIVASSFDLRLRDALQADVPPFRNAYQTSIFLSTRLAVQNIDDSTGRAAQLRAALHRWLHEPRLFEIGRTGPRALPAAVRHAMSAGDPDVGSGQAACHDDILECDAIMPQPADLFPTLKSEAFVSASILGAILLLGAALSSRTLRQLCFAQPAGVDGCQLPAPARSVWLAVLAGAALSASFVLCAAWPGLADFLTQHGMGEPMALFEGVSVWPTILLRAASFVLSLWLICHTLQSLGSNLTDTEQKMHLARPHFWFLERQYPRGRGRSVVRNLIEAFSLAWFDGRIGFRGQSHDRGERPNAPVLRLTVRYAYYGRTRWRLCRAGAATLAMFVLWWLLAPIFGQPNAPIRGHVTGTAYMVATIADVFATLFLIFLVADATLYSRSFVAQLTEIRSKWPRRTLAHFERKLGLDPAYLDDWIDIQLLVKRTKFITTLIYFPALMLALLVVSRSPVFDSYTVTPTLVIAQAISVVAIIATVFSLRRAAERAREAAVAHLTDEIIAAKGARGPEKIAEQLQMLLARVENLREGAFAPLSSQPVVKAVLLPLLSYGGTALMQMYALPGT